MLVYRSLKFQVFGNMEFFTENFFKFNNDNCYKFQNKIAVIWYLLQFVNNF